MYVHVYSIRSTTAFQYLILDAIIHETIYDVHESP